MPDSELGGALALRLGNACDQSPGGSQREPMGAERSPQRPGQKPDPRRRREGGALRIVACDSRPVEGAPRTDFRKEVSGGWLLSREGPHLAQELPTSLPQPGTASPDAGLVFTCPSCTCLEVLVVVAFGCCSFWSGTPASGFVPTTPQLSHLRIPGSLHRSCCSPCFSSVRRIAFASCGCPSPPPRASYRVSSGSIGPPLAPLRSPTRCVEREVDR